MEAIMRKLPVILGLSSEAILFDSKLYIFKAIFAIAAGYIAGKLIPTASLDMISVLLGVMYNLEPINIMGIKSGISQMLASTLGAACTGVLILLLGINVVTVAISMGLTLYISLKINWRMVSPVAIFTSIYMTQFIQKNEAGNPSIWLTFRLRVVALGVGILIAVLFNYIFSFFYYRRIALKRLEFAKGQLLSGLEYTEKQLSSQCEDKEKQYRTIFPSIFNDLDQVYSNIGLMINEAKYSFNLLHPERLMIIQRILQYFKEINHLAYDINFSICREIECEIIYSKAVEEIKESIDTLKNIDFTFGNRKVEDINMKSEEKGEVNDRICFNIASIGYYMKLIIEEANNL
jgi:hypothetical protein